MKIKVSFHLSVLAGRKELVLASLVGTVQGARVIFSHHNSPNSRALADRSWRTGRPDNDNDNDLFEHISTRI